MGVVFRGVSALVSTVVLILVAVAIAVPTYLVLTGYVGLVSEPPSPQLVTIESVSLRMVKGYVYGITLVLSNYGSEPVTVSNLSALIIRGDGRVYETILVLTKYPLKIPAGGAGEVILYPKEYVPPGRYYIKLLTPEGTSSVASLTLNKGVPKYLVALVTTANTASNPIVLQDSKCVYEVWVENLGTYYKVWFKVTPKPRVTINFYRAELLNAKNNYPVDVAGNPYVWVGPITYPNYDMEYWTPLYNRDFPVKVVFTSSK